MLKYKHNCKLLMVVLLSAILLSCASDPYNGAEGEVVVGLAYAPDVRVKSESAPAGTNIDEYVVNIYKEGEPYAGWDTYAQMPEGKKVKLKFGTYTLFAYWGVNKAVAFDNPYYSGEVEFTINDRYTPVPVDLTCSLSNTMLDIRFTDLFRKTFEEDFSSYRIDVYTDYTSTPLQFSPSETRSVYLRPSKIMLRLVARKMDGTLYDYGLNYIEGVQPKDHYTVTLDLPHQHASGFTMTVNESTREINEQHDIPFESVIVRNTRLKLSFDDEISSQAYFPSYKSALTAYFSGVKGLKDIALTVDNDFAAAYGIPTMISFASLAEDPSLVAKLKAIGFQWDENFVDKAETMFRFTDILNHILLDKGWQKDNKFAFKLIANNGEVVDKEFTIKALPLTYEAPEIVPGYIWSKEGTFNPITATNYTYPDFAQRSFIYQYSSDNGATWIDLPRVSGATLLKNLNPNTEYLLRARSDRNDYSDVKRFRTETQVQLPYSNMDTWGEDKSRGQTLFFLGEGSRDQYWSSRNNQTTNDEGTFNVNAWYVRQSGTRPTTGRSGRAAELSTSGWGTGNTWAWLLSTAIINNISSSWLLTGVVDNGGGIPLRGREFASRPTAMEFYYKYAPTNSTTCYATIEMVHKTADGQRIVIGKGEFRTGSSVGSFTKATVNINYDPAYTHLNANDIYVFFNNREQDNKDKKYISKTSNPDRYMGSTFVIDDLVLIYGK